MTTAARQDASAPAPSGHNGRSLRAPLRILVQRAAPAVIRRHLLRGLARFTALLVADGAMFLTARTLVRELRSTTVADSGVGAAVRAISPTGFLSGWEFAAALFVGLALAGAYGRGDHRRDAARVFQGVTVGTALTLWGRVWEQGIVTVSMQFAGTVAGMGVALVIGRYAADWLVGWIGALGRAERVIFVGDATVAPAGRIARRLVYGEQMVGLGWVSDLPATNGDRWLGTTSEFWHILHSVAPDTVVLTGSFGPKVFENVVEAAAAAGCRVLAVSQHGSGGRLRPRLVWQRGLPFVELTVPSLKGQQLAIKRAIDVVASAIGLVVLSPLMAFVAIRIRVDSPGPIFFAQERVGLGGKIFRMLKFRTMRDGADAEKADFAHLNCTGDPRLFKIPNDPRITKFGAFLRRWSLDEVPQLINVLRGHMSLIGPRPFFEADLAGYSDHHFSRLGAKPGITGLWQVKGRSDVVDFEEVVRLDREYIEQWSLLLDLRILLATLPAIMRKTGAY